MNSVCLVGRATRDPEIRYLQSGKGVTNIGMAVNRSKEEADFFEIEAWEKQADTLVEYVRKGHRFGIEGRLRQESWDQDGHKRSKIIVVANRIELLEPKKDGAVAAAARELGGRELRDDEVPF